MSTSTPVSPFVEKNNTADDASSTPTPELHPLRPFLPPTARCLMLGSFPPPKRRWAMNFYYPNFANDMWRIIGLIFKDDANFFVDRTNKTYHLEALIDFLTTTGIALYDTASAVRRLRDDASDKFLEVVTPTDIGALLAALPQCHTIITTGQKAADTIAAYLGVKAPTVGNCVDCEAHGVKLYRMPSSSRAYPMALEKKAAVYRRMFQEIGLLRPFDH